MVQLKEQIFQEPLNHFLILEKSPKRIKNKPKGFYWKEKYIFEKKSVLQVNLNIIY